MKLLFTGANGFVGQELLRYLSNSECQISTLSRRPLTCSLGIKQHLVSDLTVFDNWQPLLKGIDVVVHLAGLAHVKASDEEIDKTNVALPMALAQQCVAAGVKRLVFLSSLKAMGESTPERPFKAGDIEAPEDAYGRSKLSAERELQKIAARSGLELVIIRPPLVYGPGVKANFKLLQKLAALPLPLPFAMVHNRRDMVAVENLCSLMVCCLTHPAAAGQTLLVSDGEAYSLAGILRTMRQVNGRRPGLVPVPPSWLRCLLRLLGRGAMAERLLGNLEVDISETQRLLGWQPVTNLEQTLAQMLEAEKPL